MKYSSRVVGGFNSDRFRNKWLYKTTRFKACIKIWKALKSYKHEKGGEKLCSKDMLRTELLKVFSACHLSYMLNAYPDQQRGKEWGTRWNNELSVQPCIWLTVYFCYSTIILFQNNQHFSLIRIWHEMRITMSAWQSHCNSDSGNYGWLH